MKARTQRDLTRWAIWLVVAYASLTLVSCGKQVPEPVRQNSDSSRKNVILKRSFTVLNELPDISIGGACNFDLIAGVSRDQENIQIDRFGVFQYIGWAALDVENGLVGQDVTLILSSEVSGNFVVGAKRMRRQDLVDFFSNPAIIGAGFMVKANAASLPVGVYTMSVFINSGTETVKCGVEKRVTLK